MLSSRIASYVKHSAVALMGAAVLTPAFVHAEGTGAITRMHGGRDDHRDGGRHEVREVARPGYVYDSRYGHNHYYPPRGYAVGALPRGYVTVSYRGGPYYYHSGIWYRRGPSGFLVVRPAIGLFVPVLPGFYTTLWWGGVPYYYADDVYYRYRPGRGYEVVDAPSGDPSTTESSGAAPPASQADLFIYPKNGQSEEQQAKDRYECHSWAAGQSGFDPTQPLGGVDQSQAATKRADYQRAQTACLEARGYSVK
jgi:Family of unknown function (DUF6515)